MRIHLFSKKISKKTEQTIRIGDLCFLYENSCLYLWIENNKIERSNNYLNCTPVADNVNIDYPPKSETIIFSYNGLNRRTGDIPSLKILASILKKNKICDIIKNAIDILEFKEDRLDVLAITQLVEFFKTQISQQLVLTEISPKASSEKKKQEEKNKQEKITNNTQSRISEKAGYPPQAYYFYDYLGAKEQKFWEVQYQNLITHDIFKSIRLQNKKAYSTAFDKFRKEHPDLNIYSLKEEYIPKSAKTPDTKHCNKKESLHDLLIQNGYQKIDTNLWKMPTGQFLRIQVSETAEISSPNTYQTENKELKESSSCYIHTKTISVVDEDMLKQTFTHVASTYKFFWFLAILTLARNRRTEKFLFTELVARMISLAYPYIEKHFNFGHVDKIPDIIHQLISYKVLRTSLSFQTNETKIMACFKDMEYKYLLNQLLLNVPYRFLSPWITFTSNKEVIEKSNDVNFHVPYSLHSDHILLNETWHKYFKDKYDDLFKLTKSELGTYLEHYNSKPF